MELNVFVCIHSSNSSPSLKIEANSLRLMD
jgi:hypothetical protein